MGDDLLPTDPAWYAYHFWTDTVGILTIAQMGRSLGKMADTLPDSTFLWRDALLRKFLLVYILLIVNYISFIKSFA